MVEVRITDEVYERHEVDAAHPPDRPHARLLYDYWLDKRGQRKFPAWQDIDLLDLWRIASCMIIKDVIGDGVDFMNRYWGTQVTHRAGFDATGKTHREMYKDQPLGPQMDTYLAVYETGMAYSVHRSSSFIAGREFVVFNSLNLPVGKSDDKVEHILIAIDYE
ncbi:MAG: PAS domain-containing protein [Rhodospirillales bacterium]